jgi:hypothetical protein
MISNPVLPHQVAETLFGELFALPNAAIAGSERAFRAIALHGAQLPATILGRRRLFGLSYALWINHGRACLRALDLRLEIRKLECDNSKTQIPPEIPASKGAAPDHARPVYARVGVSKVSISTDERETETEKNLLPRKRYREASGIFATLKALLSAAGVTLTHPDSVIFGRRFLAVRGQLVEVSRAADVPLDSVLARLVEPLAACVRAGGGLVQFVANWSAGAYAGLMPAPRPSGGGRYRTPAGGRMAPRETDEGGAGAHDPRRTAAVLDELAAVKLARPEIREAALAGIKSFLTRPARA